MHSQSSTNRLTKQHTLFFLFAKKSALLRLKISCFVHKNMHEDLMDLPTERHPPLQPVSLYVSCNTLAKYTHNLPTYVQATHQQGCFGNKLSQIAWQCFRAVSPVRLGVDEGAEKQNACFKIK